MTWSPVTESNRRPSPYHVPLDGSRGPGTASDQVIRWHKLAGTNLNQRRQAPFCLSKCPSGSAVSVPPWLVAYRFPSCSSTATKVRQHARQQRDALAADVRAGQRVSGGSRRPACGRTQGIGERTGYHSLGGVRGPSTGMEVKEPGRVTAELLVKFRAAISPQGAHHARSSAQRHLTHMTL